MIVEPVEAKIIRIREAKHLDPILVMMWDAAAGNGQLVITCFGRSWSYYWSAMGDRTVAQFMQICTTDYLVQCLSRSNLEIISNQRLMKTDERYLSRIVDAVKEALEVAV